MILNSKTTTTTTTTKTELNQRQKKSQGVITQIICSGKGTAKHISRNTFRPQQPRNHSTKKHLSEIWRKLAHAPEGLIIQVFAPTSGFR